jgi:hypothetical protein
LLSHPLLSCLFGTVLTDVSQTKAEAAEFPRRKKGADAAMPCGWYAATNTVFPFYAKELTVLPVWQ